MKTDISPVAGAVRRYAVDPLDRRRRRDGGVLLPAGWRPATRWRRNTVLKGWGGVLAPLLAGRPGAGPAAWVYVEFEQRPDDTPATAPGYGRGPAAGYPYYQGLAGVPGRDFLRVPVLGSGVTAEDPDAPAGDTARLFAEVGPGVGVHGREFSAAAHARVFGYALAAGPDPDDPSRDVVACRIYPPAGEQFVCPAAGSAAVQWRVQFL